MSHADAGSAPVIAVMPMGGGAVCGPGAGKLHVRWGVGNELRVCRLAGDGGGGSTAHETSAAVAPDGAADGADGAASLSSGAAYVVQW